MGMTLLSLAHGVIGASWIALFGYWVVSAWGAAPHADPAVARRDLALRIVIGVGIGLSATLALRLPFMRSWQHEVFTNHPLALAGAALTASGAVLGIASRRALGRNWGMPGSRKADTELVTSGPYAVVRHPIYTAIILMATGSTIGLTPAWGIATVLMAAYFLWNARREEAIMLERFPEAYPAYRASTKMLVPFLL